MTTQWYERARQKASELKISDVQLAQKIGWGKSIVNAWMNGNRPIKLEQKMAIADALGVTVCWLDTGEQEKNPHAIPLITLDDVKAIRQQIEEKHQAIKTDPGILFPIVESVSNSFLIRLDNDSMIDPNNAQIRHIPSGSHVQIDVEQTPTPGKILLIEHDGRMMLRVWQRMDANEHIFRVINPLYRDLTISYRGNIMDIYQGTAVGFSCPL